MSAEILRRAASLMRERAESATRGPWGNDSRLGVYVEQIDGDHSTVAVDSDGYEADGEHIASWHPAVALAVADWLERLHDFLTSDEYDRDEELEAALAGDVDAMPLSDWPEVESALTVARAYLGESA